jgi:hypothetical protein
MARKNALFEIVGACEENAEARKDAEQKGVVFTCETYDELLENKDIEAIVIGSCYGDRGAMAIKALKSGKHVICDKPLCTKIKELDKIEKLAKAKNLMVSCMFTMRFEPKMKAVKTLLDSGELGKINTFDFDGEYLTWTTDGANAGTVFYRKGKFSITNVCGLLKVKKNNLLVKYLYYALSIEAPKYVSSGMGNPKLMSNVMARIRVPLPSFKEQVRIAAILDRFDTLCNDLTAGLPAEIEARRKQYEYYRDKLLTFKPLA